jgi:thioredoxin-dependent peroxiredoxin
MEERTEIVTMKGNPLALVGGEVRAGESAPDFEVVDNGLAIVRFSSYNGKVCIISSVPSLDTPVCDMETRKFNDMAGKLRADTVILTISMDLPFAQKRWCGSAGVENVITLSDHRQAEFGKTYGVLIKDLRLLARAVFVIDPKGIVRYRQVVSEVAEEPDYDSVLKAIQELE